MKKIVVFLFFLSLILNVKAQTTPWISQGATWFYTWWVPGYGGNDKIEYIHDTILLGKICEILKTTSYTYGQPGPGLPPILFSTQVQPYNYTCSNGDTVFYFNNNRFSILYNFGAQVNDTWDLGVDTNSTYCSRSTVQVDSISTQIINSNTHRVLFTGDSANSSVGITKKIIEHIGSMDYLFPTGRNCDPKIAVDFPIYSFSCFQDITTNYLVVTPPECENPYHVGIRELTNRTHNIECYPNPIENNLNIHFSNEAHYLICIYNLLGEKIIETQNQKNKSTVIDMSNLDSGIYIATFVNSAGEKINKKIIKN